jgi:hypothetical protein
MNGSAVPATGDPAAQYAHRLLDACSVTTQRVDACDPVGPALGWARSGAMALTGDPDDAPRFAPGPLATAMSGAARALALLAPGTPLGALDGPALLGERAALAHLSRNGRSSAGGAARLIDVEDAAVVVHLAREEDWSSIPACLASDEARHWVDSSDRWARLEATLSTWKCDALVERARLLGLAVAPAAKKIRSDTSCFRLDAASESQPLIERPKRRLLDLTHLWAGPLATSLLAIAGIEVVKIEAPERPDGARRGPRPFFDLMNGNKRGAALDLTRASDRSTFERLLDSADVVFESSRPRALEQLGYDAASWTSGRAGRLWVSITGYGRRAPGRDWIAYGDDAAAAAGLAWAPRPDENEKHAPKTPSFCGDAIADPIAGLHAAVIALAHLRAGRGGVLDLSLFDLTSYAASFDAGALTLPIEHHADGPFVCVDGALHPISPPRARPVTGKAPDLAPPDRSLLESGSAPC